MRPVQRRRAHHNTRSYQVVESVETPMYLSHLLAQRQNQKISVRIFSRFCVPAVSGRLP